MVSTPKRILHHMKRSSLREATPVPNTDLMDCPRARIHLAYYDLVQRDIGPPRTHISFFFFCLFYTLNLTSLGLVKLICKDSKLSFFYLFSRTLVTSYITVCTYFVTVKYCGLAFKLGLFTKSSFFYLYQDLTYPFLPSHI